MEPQSLDYAQTLARLMSMLDQHVEVALRGVGRAPPLFASFTGTLRTSEAYGGELVGWDRDALNIQIGDVSLTLHPDHFVDAIFNEGPRRERLLKLTMGGVELISGHRCILPAGDEVGRTWPVPGASPGAGSEGARSRRR